MVRGVESKNVNLDQAWQDTVQQLAQVGSPKALTFWLNQFLLPQRICAQVIEAAPGTIWIKVLCHHAWERDRLIQLMVDRLRTLQTNPIESFRLTAQVVGAAQPLWDEQIQLTAAGHTNQPTHQPTQPTHQPTHQPTNQPVPSARSLINELISETQANVDAPSDRPSEQMPGLTVEQEQAVHDALGLLASRSIKRKKRKPLPAWKRAARRAIDTMQGSIERIGRLELPEFSRNSQPRSIRSLGDVQQVVVDWTGQAAQHSQKVGKQLTRSSQKSVRWFKRQPRQKQLLLVVGSATAAFLLGSGIQLLADYVMTPSFQLAPTSQANGRVKSNSGYVPVIQQPVLNPDDPTVTLLFSSSAALNHRSKSAGDSDKIVPYRRADVLMTSLTGAITETATQSNLTFDPQADDPQADDPQADDPQADRSAIASDEHLSAELSSESSDSQSGMNANSTSLQSLLANGVDVVNLANDHQLHDTTATDVGTVDRLQQNAVYSVGTTAGGTNPDRPVIMDVKGQRIAYLGYSDAEIHTVDRDKVTGLGTRLNQRISQDIDALRNQVDLVIVSFQWSQELRAYPETWQVNLARFAIDQGADLVVGYQPGITQGAEVYKGRAIAYSLGNAIDDYSNKPSGNYDTAVLQVRLRDQQIELEFVPVQVRQGQINLAEGETGAAILQYLTQASSLFEYPLRSSTTLPIKNPLTRSKVAP